MDNLPPGAGADLAWHERASEEAEAEHYDRPWSILRDLADVGDSARAWLEADGSSERRDPPAPVDTGLADQSAFFAQMVLAEVNRARGFFPGPNANAVALIEEAGELADALIGLRSGTDAPADVRKELLQVAAMCVRLATEGDPFLALDPLFPPRHGDQVAAFPQPPRTDAA